MTRTHVALLRGINVGGANKLPMADLRGMATGLGLDEVATHLASGNLVFSATQSGSAIERDLAAAVAERMGKPIELLVVGADEWLAAVAGCPYQPSDDKLVHLQVHRRPVPEKVRAAIDEMVDEAGDGTEATVDGRWLYLHTPNGFSKSVAFTKLPKLVGKDDPGTARNLNTAKAIAALLE
ncbi:DUF1697 domain-containing protein [Aestuariimicrobium ganziense]|uniref:DUF1697 domain-containing protein n=1 Tax=Aestuariimicrobium ganziense TaxID=2773677 RepID=UPI001945846A|nr:DUF1697 domain-containing protein [Aestuariimicrobium ganziense]